MKIVEKIYRTKELTPIIITLGGDESSNMAIIILNSGLIHHVGAGRFSVKLARAAAEAGITAVRFDFAGLGDNGKPPSIRRHLEAAPEAVSDVIDSIQNKFGINQFAIFGLCSGSDAAFISALRDRRIVAMAQLDPYLFRTKRWYFEHYKRRLFSISAWVGAVSRALRSVKGRKNKFAESGFYQDDREMLAKGDICDGYRDLVKNKVNMLVIVTGGQEYSYNYRDQFPEIYSDVDFGVFLEIKYYPEAEHILPEPKYQKRVKQDIVSWMLATFGDE